MEAAAVSYPGFVEDLPSWLWPRDGDRDRRAGRGGQVDRRPGARRASSASPTWTAARCTAASACCRVAIPIDRAAELARAARDRAPGRRRRPRACLLDGRDVSEAIRTPEVSEAASRVAADPGVRAALVAKQRELLARGDWVAEGRDIGTVVAPEAAVRCSSTAEPRERARRRAAELGVGCGGGAEPSRRCATSATAPARTARCARRRARACSTRPAWAWRRSWGIATLAAPRRARASRAALGRRARLDAPCPVWHRLRAYWR